MLNSSIVLKMSNILARVERGDNILKDDREYYNENISVIRKHFKKLASDWECAPKKLNKDGVDVLKPSNFMCSPMSSVKQNSESESFARNIMVFLARTGDTWRQMTWEEYCKEYNKGHKNERISATRDSYWKRYFDNVVQYTMNPGMAASFSPVWEEIYNKVNS